jgi:hypothetical protein
LRWFASRSLQLGLLLLFRFAACEVRTILWIVSFFRAVPTDGTVTMGEEVDSNCCSGTETGNEFVRGSSTTPTAASSSSKLTEFQRRSLRFSGAAPFAWPIVFVLLKDVVSIIRSLEHSQLKNEVRRLWRMNVP